MASLLRRITRYSIEEAERLTASILVHVAPDGKVIVATPLKMPFGEGESGRAPVQDLLETFRKLGLRQAKAERQARVLQNRFKPAARQLAHQCNPKRFWPEIFCVFNPDYTSL